MKKIKRWIENGFEYVLRENELGYTSLGKYPIKNESQVKKVRKSRQPSAGGNSNLEG